MADPSPLRRLRYRLLSGLPGERGRRYLRKHLRARGGAVLARFDRALSEVAGRDCIDLGANLGEITGRMAAVAGRVHAFEPDPWTADRLRTAMANLDNVEIVEAAAGTEAGTADLYRHSDWDADPAAGSLSSSLMPTKRNIDAERAISIRVVDFPAWLSALDTDVGILKMDIEGGEVALLEALLDRDALRRVAYVFVETHETKIPELARRTATLRRRTARMTAPVVEMGWH